LALKDLAERSTGYATEYWLEVWGSFQRSSGDLVRAKERFGAF